MSKIISQEGQVKSDKLKRAKSKVTSYELQGHAMSRVTCQGLHVKRKNTKEWQVKSVLRWRPKKFESFFSKYQN